MTDYIALAKNNTNTVCRTVYWRGFTSVLHKKLAKKGFELIFLHELPIADARSAALQLNGSAPGGSPIVDRDWKITGDINEFCFEMRRKISPMGYIDMSFDREFEWYAATLILKYLYTTFDVKFPLERKYDASLNLILP